MFKGLKKTIAGWFKPQVPAPRQTPKSHRQAEVAPRAAEGSAKPPRVTPGSGGFPPPARQFRAPRKARAVPAEPKAAKTPAPEKRKRPARPAELKSVAPAEGKTRFLDLPLHEDIQFGLQQLNFEYCTPIQALAMPHLLAGRDLAGKAQTGTGKTAAFLAAAFTNLLNHPRPVAAKPGCPRMLVLAPTRELAIQIHKDAEAIGLFAPLKCVVVFGGMDHEKQRRELEREIDVVIGTPGRVIDYSRGGSLDLSRVEILVIDEADRMLDMGFIPDVKRIVSQLPRKGERHTMLFSATLDESILRLSSGWLADPVTVESEPEHLVGDTIEQIFYTVSRDEKLALLLYFLQHGNYDRILVFGNRKDVNLRLQHDLAKYGVQAPILSGDIAQEKRIKILEKFRTGEVRLVIATDVAARGIHVDDISLVINYDLPEHPEDYVHRIGRTGRAGHSGKAISFLCEYGAYNLDGIEKLLNVRFPSILPEEEMLRLPPQVPVTERPAVDRKPEERGRSGRPRRSGSRRR